MRYHRHMRNWMIGISIAFLIISIVFSCLQIVYRENVTYAVLNNVSICIFTGSLIALLQFAIGYHNVKYDCILTYYKYLVMFEERITYYPYQHCGFVDSVSGLKEIREILDFYYSYVQISYKMLDFNGYNDCVMRSAKELHELYSSQTQPFVEFRDALCDGVRFMGASNETLWSEGITDIKKATEEMNSLLQSKEEAVRERYNDKNEQEKRNAAYKTLERYLFGKQGKSKKDLGF